MATVCAASVKMTLNASLPSINRSGKRTSSLSSASLNAISPEHHRPNTLSGHALATENPIALVVPGTGLGQAFSIGSPERRCFISSEAAHVYWTATSDLGRELDHFLRLSRGRQTRLEDVISGPGMVNIFDFFCNRRGLPPVQVSGITVSELVQKSETRSLPLKYVSAAHDTLTFFVTELAMECAQMAARANAKGGIILAGEVVLARIDQIQESSFTKRFISCDWGDQFLSTIPLVVSRTLFPAQLGVSEEWKKQFS